MTNEFPFEGIQLSSLTDSFQNADNPDSEDAPGPAEASFFNNLIDSLGGYCIDSSMGPTGGDE